MLNKKIKKQKTPPPKKPEKIKQEKTPNFNNIISEHIFSFIYNTFSALACRPLK